MRVRPNWSPLVVVSAAVAGVLAASPAAAQGFELNRFHPASSVREGYVTVEDGRAGMAGAYEANLWLHYANDPLVYHPTTGDSQRAVAHHLMADVVVSYALFDRLRLSLDLPINLVQSSDLNVPGAAAFDGAGIGDIRFTPKVALFDGRRDGGSGSALSIALPLVLPSGDDDRMQGGPFRAVPTIAFDHVLGSGIGLGVNAGFTIGGASTLGNIEADEQFHYGLAAKLPVSDPMDVIVELVGGLPLGGIDAEHVHMEGIGAVRYAINDVVLGGGGALGLREGWGTPDFRVFFNVGWAPVEEEEPPPPPPPSDRDGDGYIDTVDACPDEPEDFDGFQDEEGCPDPDNDGDGILDVDDACPNDAEDLDGFEDVDGCPDPDNDEDGVLDADDLCPGTDGYVPDEVREVYNDFEDDDGCPDVLAEVVEDRIDINGTIYFDLDSAVIQERSFGILDDVAEILTSHPEITLVEVAGHTDAQGDDDYNLDLSQRRVESVVEGLVERGIDTSRLRPVGYGESVLIDPADTEEAHQRNRRVEFNILERADVEQ